MSKPTSLSHRIFVKTAPLIRASLGLFGRDMYARMYGRRFYYDPRTDIGEKILRVGSFERAELAIVKHLLKPDSVALDIGANIGTYSVFMADAARKGTVIAFEPSRDTYSFLLKNTRGFDNFLPVNMAVSDVCGIVTFHAATDNAYSGLKETGKRPITRTEKVVATTLDSFVGSLGLAKIDFIKIDVEGLENEVIAGARDTLARYRPFVLMEIEGSARANPHPEKTVSAMVALGYSAHVIRGWELAPFTAHDDAYYNYLFVPAGRTIPEGIPVAARSAHQHS